MKTNPEHLKALAIAAGGGTYKGDWKSTGVVIAASDEGGMHYLFQHVHGEIDTPALAFVEAANPNAVLALVEELRAAQPAGAADTTASEKSLDTLEFMANAQAWARAYAAHDMAEERRQWRIMVDCLNAAAAKPVQAGEAVDERGLVEACQNLAGELVVEKLLNENLARELDDARASPAPVSAQQGAALDTPETWELIRNYAAALFAVDVEATAKAKTALLAHLVQQGAASREHFEKIAQQCGVYTCNFARYDEARAAHANKDRSLGEDVAPGDYVSRTLQSCWKVYQAAAKTPAAQADDPPKPAGSAWVGEPWPEWPPVSDQEQIDRDAAVKFYQANPGAALYDFMGRVGRGTTAPAAQAVGALLQALRLVVDEPADGEPWVIASEALEAYRAASPASTPEAAQADDLRLAICNIPLPVYGSNSFQHGFVSAKEAVLDLLSKRAATTAGAATTSEDALEQLLIEHRIGLTPENEGGFHAEVYSDQEIPKAKGYGQTPRAAIDAAMRATQQEGE
jgi:hypothetical protein